MAKYLFIAIILLAAVADASITLTPLLDYTIPGYDDIDVIDFDDVKFDGIPEILFEADGHYGVFDRAAGVVLYLIEIDSCYNHRAILADVNRDLIPDIVIGYYFEVWDYSDSAAAIDFYDGANGYAKTRIYYQNRDGSCSGFCTYTYARTQGVRALSAGDLDGDGYNELFFTFSNIVTQHEVTIYDTSRRSLPLFYDYYSFPDSINYLFTSDLAFLKHEVTDGNILNIFRQSNSRTEIHQYYSPDYGYTNNYLLIFPDNLSTQTEINYETESYPCPDYYTYGKYLFDRCIGDLIPNNGSLEILAGYEFFWTCHYPYSDIIQKGTQLYTVNPYGIADIVWEKEVDAAHDYTAHPNYPGYYFAFLDNDIVAYNGFDGSVAETSPVSISGSYFWGYPYNNNVPYLVVQSGNTVTLYDLNTTLGTDGDVVAQLPDRISINSLYPNPFNNTQKIEISTPVGGEVIVEVYNILGQKVAEIYRGRPLSPQLNITWQADKVASGIYLIRASTDKSFTVKKSILMK